MYENNIKYYDDSEKKILLFKETLLKFNDETKQYGFLMEDCCLIDDFLMLRDVVDLMIKKCAHHVDRIDDLRLDCLIADAVENDDS
jgi:hypothetical protein